MNTKIKYKTYNKKKYSRLDKKPMNVLCMQCILAVKL